MGSFKMGIEEMLNSGYEAKIRIRLGGQDVQVYTTRDFEKPVLLLKTRDLTKILKDPNIRVLVDWT